MAGIAGAQTHNYEGGAYRGVAGIAGGWGISPGASLMILRIKDNQGLDVFASSSAECITYAAKNGADVMNMSWGWYNWYGYYEDVVNEAADDYDCIMVAISHNDGVGSIRYPAKYAKTIAVGATDENDVRRISSNFGPELDVVAPSHVPTTTLNNGYLSSFTGTSAAAPHVAGMSALIRSLNPSITWQQVRETIRLSADKVAGMGGQNFTNEYGYGRINANKAVHYLYVPQVYATIQAAINAAVSGQTVHVSSGTYSGNITMKNGVDVIGTSAASTIINGTVTFTNTTSDLKKVTVNKQITINGGNNNVINNVRAKKRISINGGYHYLQYVTTYQYDYTYGVDIVNSYSPITYYTSTNSRAEPSIYGHDYAGPNICCSTIKNKGIAIKVGYRSFFTVSGLDFCQNDWDIYAISSAYDSDAYDSNVFSAEDPEDCIYGDVNLPDPEDWEWCGLRKAISGPYLAQDGDETFLNLKNLQTDWDDYRQAVTIYNNIVQQLLYDLAVEDDIHTERYEKDFNDAIKLFKQVISDSAQSNQAVQALKYIETCYYELGRPEAVFDYLSSIADDVKFESLHLHALRLLVSYYLTKEDPAQALELSDRILAKYSNDDLVVEIIYGKGIIYKYYLNDLEKASDIFRQVIAEYPDHPTALSAQAELEDMGESVPGGAPTEPETVEALALEGYPNPFNPTATIRFGLPQGGNVTLVVYDLMGREVVRLIEGYRDAGWQAVVWNGRDAGGREVPTGIYIARLATPQETRAIKLVMMK